jgi:16S rRNA (guanine527-N7)-methyltransferase
MSPHSRNVPEPRSTNDAWIALPSLFPHLANPDQWLPALQAHARLLAAAEPRVRVTTVRSEHLVQRQYAESLELWRILVEAAAGPPGLVADVGSGGGFPGLVMATVAPATRFVLIEPLRKRAGLLRAAAAELGLSNVEVLATRAEEAGRGDLRDSCPAVVARAVAPLAELLEYTAPLVAPGGLLLLPKGSGLERELEEAAPALQALACSVVKVRPMRPEVSQLVRVLVLRKDGPTPAAYPRRPGVPRKRPLAIRA